MAGQPCMTGIETLFWLSLSVIVYSYPGYPTLLWFLSRFSIRARSQRAETGEENLPSVTLIISAYNEEKVIGEKINNALSLEYPKDLLEIVVVSDGSDDRTTEIASQFAAMGIRLLHYEKRTGKTACLNKAVPLATRKIIVFSDANSSYDKHALKALVRPFQDSTVGFVTGWTRYGSGGDPITANPISFYAKLELVTKELESIVGSCVGADGAIFAIRKELFIPLEEYDINDFVIPMSIIRQGYRGVLERKAFCFENTAGGTKREFHRQVRIASRTIRAIMNYHNLLNPLRFGFFSIQLLSHKLSRLLVPLFMVLLLVSNLPLASTGGFYLMVLTGQVLLYGGASATNLVPRTGVLSRLADAAQTFVVINMAIVLAWAKYLRGETYTTWSPTQR